MDSGDMIFDIDCTVQAAPDFALLAAIGVRLGWKWMPKHPSQSRNGNAGQFRGMPPPPISAL